MIKLAVAVLDIKLAISQHTNERAITISIGERD
ncbi:Uncharacterised protein [Vibrio cholerae]|nr:Uncharacterised protein [Vibrio cholerae]